MNGSTTELRRGATVATSAVLLLVLMTACHPAAPLATHKPVRTHSTSPTPTVTPTVAAPALPVVPGDELLTISAQAKAPNGAVLDLSMTVHYPIAYNTPNGQAITAYLSSIGDTSEITATPGVLASGASSLQIMDVTAKAVSGTWPATSGVLLDFGPNNTGAAFDIPTARAGGTQGSFVLLGAGTGNAVTRIDGIDGAVDPASWSSRFTYYGFSAFSGMPAVLSGCTIAFTAKGQNADTASWGDNWNPLHQYCVAGVGD
jgi:hypothetical protein